METAAGAMTEEAGASPSTAASAEDACHQQAVPSLEADKPAAPAPAAAEPAEEAPESEAADERQQAEEREEASDEEGPLPAKAGGSLSLFVGQEVRLHLVDLLRTRLTAIPAASLASMNSFFRQMYGLEVETDAELARVYAQHSGSKAHRSLRPCRRIRGTLTTVYSSRRDLTELKASDASSCGLELCFRVVVCVPSAAAVGGRVGFGSRVENREFVIFRRWPIGEFLALRRHYKEHHHVDIFVEKRTNKEEEGGWQPQPAVDRFAAMRPDLLSAGGAAGCDPFLLNGSALAHLLVGDAAADNNALHAAAASRKRGRPRKYPRLEYTGAPVEGPLQQQLRPVGAPEGPYGVTLKELGVPAPLAEWPDSEATAPAPRPEPSSSDQTETEGRLTRPRRSKEGAMNWRHRLEDTAELRSALRARGPRGGPPKRPLQEPQAASPLPTDRGGDSAANWKPHSDQLLGVEPPFCASELVIDERASDEKKKKQKTEDEEVRQQCRHDTAQVARMHEALGRLQNQEEERIASFSHLTSSSPYTKSRFLSFPPEEGPSLKLLAFEPKRQLDLHELLRPYYRRCTQLLLCDLLHCLQLLPYGEAALRKRMAAVAKCLELVDTPTVDLSALQTLVNHFGSCVKSRSSLSELDRHTQEQLVEDVLYLSRYLCSDDETARPLASSCTAR
ncbi:hypothetical protein Efla_003640 [Eimeria flavescens]